MINAASLINDSPNRNGVNDNSQSVWSYNQGVILSGLSDLAELSGDRSYLDSAEKIADVEKVDTIFKDGVGYDPVKLRASVQGLAGIR